MAQDRVFFCALCDRRVRICQSCDHGNRYCSESCSLICRLDSCRAAGRRYQETPQGRDNHARRQAQYRERQAENVTHHGSAKSSRSTILRKSKPPVAVSSSLLTRSLPKVCSFCGSLGTENVRFRYLHEDHNIP